MITRRQAIKTAALGGVALAAAPTLFAKSNPAVAAPAVPAASPFTLPKLPYAFDALEPHIDARTMEIHHDRHHKAYVDNLNKAAGEITELGELDIEHLLGNLSDVPEKIRTAVRNHGGGHYNHLLFWQMMKPGGSPDPIGKLAHALDQSFGSLNAFKEQFAAAAVKIFGSGWAWLILDGKELKIETTPNQDTPLSSGKQVLLGLDVWEHAYYLKFQNKRADYITAWWKVVNWEFVTERYEKLKKA